MKNLKLISIMLLSIMFIFTISTAVFADNQLENEDIWSDGNTWGNEVPVEGNSSVENTNVNSSANESLFENVEVENEVENVVEEDDEENEYNNLYTTKNYTTSNSENLADTGIGDSSVMALIVIVSSVVAIYSARKFNEYKNI